MRPRGSFMDYVRPSGHFEQGQGVIVFAHCKPSVIADRHHSSGMGFGRLVPQSVNPYDHL